MGAPGSGSTTKLIILPRVYIEVEVLEYTHEIDSPLHVRVRHVIITELFLLKINLTENKICSLETNKTSREILNNKLTNGIKKCINFHNQGEIMILSE